MEKEFWDLIGKVIVEVGPQKAALTFFQFTLTFLLLLFGSNIIPKLKDIIHDFLLAKKLKRDKEKDMRIAELETDIEIVRRELGVLNKMDLLLRYFDSYLEESHRIKTSVSLDTFKNVVTIFLGKEKSFSFNIKRTLFTYFDIGNEEGFNMLKEENKDYFSSVILNKIEKFILNDRLYSNLVKDRSYDAIDLFFDNIKDYDKRDLPLLKIKVSEDILELISSLSDILVSSYIETLNPLTNLNYVELPEGK